MFDRLYQENWLEQVTTKKGQSNWSIASLCSELVAKMAKDIGMTIRKGIVVPFLPCLVAFWGFHPYMFFHFFLMFFCYFSYKYSILLCSLFTKCGIYMQTGKFARQVSNSGYYILCTECLPFSEIKGQALVAQQICAVQTMCTVIKHIMEYGSTPYIRDAQGKNDWPIECVQNDLFKSLLYTILCPIPVHSRVFSLLTRLIESIAKVPHQQVAKPANRPSSLLCLLSFSRL